ncbi:hypothetical protein ACTJJ7_15650 [Phyllobacterium sp. 22229]|uniref:hypothetical protein n=1 Tax=Phyllobacterium sp. 22229 TaxID=3453895 RepID=UPI003F84533F
MKLLLEWRAVLMMAWSARLIAIAAMLDGVAPPFPYLQDTLAEPEKPFWQSPAFIATTDTGGLVTTAVANVGTIPWQNLVVLVAAAFLGLVGYRVYDWIWDRRKQDANAEAIKS